MEKILIVSNTEKHISYFNFVLNNVNSNNNPYNTTVVHTVKEARALITDNEYDLVIIDSPLTDELGKNFSIEIKQKSISQVIYCEDSENFETTEKELLYKGVLTISKPFNRKHFIAILKTCIANHVIFKKIYNENKILSKQIEEIKLIDRAKCVLISYLRMNEKQAHKYIEKQAMDHRLSKTDIATRILKTYEG